MTVKAGQRGSYIGRERINSILEIPIYSIKFIYFPSTLKFKILSGLVIYSYFSFEKSFIENVFRIL